MSEFRDVINRIAGELPEGWQIVISLEFESGGVELFDPDGGEVEFPSCRECMEDELLDALEHAKERDREGIGA